MTAVITHTIVKYQYEYTDDETDQWVTKYCAAAVEGEVQPGVVIQQITESLTAERGISEDRMSAFVVEYRMDDGSLVRAWTQ